jgi:ATP-dependent protease HslVU (ClpYQ) peptidase subunit
MTLIVVRKKEKEFVVLSDGLVTDSHGDVYAEDNRKVFAFGRGCVGVAGDLAVQTDLKFASKDVNSGEEIQKIREVLAEREKSDAEVLLVLPSSVWLICAADQSVCKVNKFPRCIGSGAQMAQGALAVDPNLWPPRLFDLVSERIPSVGNYLLAHTFEVPRDPDDV